ncbi:hypothetical protein COCSADRAFT_173619 [Bipolaris sorokiniana ND90Pr]|uniref:Cyclase n=1 Tax=Cochliobolus sativus (strain ND90Pr / ATCC 201652) TaxID=665912 RepID=M2R502_COCSN|nr:uncharacterized protein COCSADRAFT_173619 [Bipolaris sorokiniana ND90Pr]EMD62239.1 hypothetical protein COCSADRAFT_173619 [Bipolaris sorokiniana ND90Pr]
MSVPTTIFVYMNEPGDKGRLWGADDQLGTLNYLTDEVVKVAANEEIRTGTRVSLNWSMMGPSKPRFPRKFTEVKLINKAPMKTAHDEELHFNTQISSQWDGTRHYGYQNEKVYFMGHTAEKFKNSDINSLQTQGLSIFDFREADILFVRSGYIHQHEVMSPERRKKLHVYQREKPENIGLETSKELLEFLGNTRFAAVAAGRGMPIGELFDLEHLGTICNELGKYTFFISSEPLNVPGGVASPPNALAFF